MQTVEIDKIGVINDGTGGSVNTYDNSSLVPDTNKNNILVIEVKRYTWAEFSSGLWLIDFTPASKSQASVQIPATIEDLNLRRILHQIVNKIDEFDGIRKGDKLVKNSEMLYTVKRIEERLP